MSLVMEMTYNLNEHDECSTDTNMQTLSADNSSVHSDNEGNKHEATLLNTGSIDNNIMQSTVNHNCAVSDWVVSSCIVLEWNLVSSLSIIQSDESSISTCAVT